MTSLAEPDADAELARWAASGCMALTGGPGSRRLGPPRGMVTKLQALADRHAAATGAIGRRVDIDPLALLAERAALLRFEPQGTTSCGGSTRLLRGSDGWLAVSLARDDDIDLVPAWLELHGAPTDAWAAIGEVVPTRSAAALVERGAWLGLPIALLPVAGSTPEHALEREVLATRSPTPALDRVLVVDLSSLWAGPLAGGLLAQAGARVVKVESSTRPDGARLGPPAFYDLLNGGKEHHGVDLQSESGRAELRELLAAADVVIEASRPRALEQLGIDARGLLADAGPSVWASITGHGRTGAGRERVAFGDDAAVAGGLVCWDHDIPVFCVDAVADPTTGLVAATEITEALVRGETVLLDVAMAGVARHLAGPTVAHDLPPESIAAPRATRRPRPVSPRG